MPALPQGQGARRRADRRRGRPRAFGIGARQNRAYLLESIVDPNKQIAQGFESVVLATSDGKVLTGVLRGEDDKEVRLITAEGKPLAVPKDSIEERKRGPSAMPADLAQKLSKTELRDLIEFLASLKAVERNAFWPAGRRPCSTPTAGSRLVLHDSGIGGG